MSKGFREFGIPQRIAKCYDVLDILQLSDKHSGKNNCYVSVYTFTETNQGKTVYDSAVINTIWFDFDHDKDVNKCLKDVRKLYNRYCKPNNLVPRIYYTGGRGFQLNIDFPLIVNIVDDIKRVMIKDYLLFLKDKYTLTTLDTQCINNSVSCLRRMPDTPYINKKTGEPNGQKCIQITVDEMLQLELDDIITLSYKDNTPIINSRNNNLQAAKDFIYFVCDKLGISYTPTNSIEHLINSINGKEYNNPRGDIKLDYIIPPRDCILALINEGIERGHLGHSENTAIAVELINANWKSRDIAFVFKAIFNDEPAGDWGWYNDDGSAGYHITNLRAKGINRYSGDKLVELKICKHKYCVC